MKDLNLVVLQARMSSTRLPGKVLAEINGRPMIYWEISRIRKAKLVHKVVVVISDQTSDDILAKYLGSIGQEYIRGSLDNVLERYVIAEVKYKPSSIIRLTADCPLVMPDLIDQFLEIFNQNDFDYLSNTLELSYPDGLDIEIIAPGILKKLLEFSLSKDEKEHVTLGIYSRKNKFRTHNVSLETNLSYFRWTVDTPDDLAFIKLIYANFESMEIDFTFEDVLKFIEANPNLNRIMPRLANKSLLVW
jgi:spore coat polysaccharide biosynthesis protein SpsF